jgi:hypothetical protein
MRKIESLRFAWLFSVVSSIIFFFFFSFPASASNIAIPILENRTGGLNNTCHKTNCPLWATVAVGDSYDAPIWVEGTWYIDIRGLNPYWYDWRYYASFYPHSYIGFSTVNSASITFTPSETGGIAPLWNVRLFLSSDVDLNPPTDGRALYKSCGDTPISDDIFALSDLDAPITFNLNAYGISQLENSTASFTTCIREIQYDFFLNDPNPYNETYATIVGSGDDAPILNIDYNPIFPEIGGYEYGMGTIGYPLTLLCPINTNCLISFDYSIRDAGTDIYLVPTYPTPCVPENAVSSTTLPFFTGQALMSVPTSTVATATKYCLYFNMLDGTAGIDNNFKVVWYGSSSIAFPSVDDPFCSCTATTTLDSIFCGLKKLACWAIIPPEELTGKLAETQGKLSKTFPFSSFSDVRDRFKDWEELSTSSSDGIITVHVGENNSIGLDQFDFTLVSSSTLKQGIGSSTKTMVETSLDFILYFLACLYIFLRILFNH